MTTPHSRYAHIYVVVRVDAGVSSEDSFSLVSAWPTEDEAVAEAKRLLGLAPEGATYRVVVTRLKSGKLS